MKLATVLYRQNSLVGVIVDEGIALLPSPEFPAQLEEWIKEGDALLQRAKEALSAGKVKVIAHSDAKILAPLSTPGKIVAIGLNYFDHCREQNIPVPDRPIVFTKFNTSIIGPGDPISWDSTLTQQVDYEVELGVVIGKRAKSVPVTEALDYVFGYTIINDVSARDLQFSDRQWVRAKSLDTFCPMGPAIVTKDEIPDPQHLELRTLLNGEVVQNSTTAEMVFSVADLVSFLSHSFTLEPGDVIATGTPDGVGVFRKPPVFLKHGDRVVLEIEKIGRLENPVCLS
ncbi:2-keto-4-pentenoate hydratase [Anaerolinea thermolimosa]|uniref:fumarylacetoacetate hydrolase family protein n=1 Tax=Anaerolinea thermolimosa TaxID=229919 RepID=UPI000780FD52|nr:fumarylacetoacetate hydrolase family protein [Anaerolinea thermolimosa]GAP06629.1 2-keto-4-pentenoate hydratase [Anaerolinea thermolimosa]